MAPGGCIPMSTDLSAVLSRQLADGHLCLDLELLPTLAQEQDWPADWRALADELRAGGLPASPLLAANRAGEPDNAPLVLDGTRLYLRRYWNHERQVAQGILARVTRAEPSSPHLAEELARLFPPDRRSGFSRDNDAASIPVAAEAAPTAAPATSPMPDWPRIACALAVRGAFSVITGGPGTGKTTTVVRLLGLLQTLQLREHAQPLRIRLAAPPARPRRGSMPRSAPSSHGWTWTRRCVRRSPPRSSPCTACSVRGRTRAASATMRAIRCTWTCW